MKNTIILKTKFGLNRPTLATLDQGILVDHILRALSQTSSTETFTVHTTRRDKSHTKAASAYGGGEVVRHVFRSTSPTIVNGETLYPQITILDRTFSGGSLKVFVGFYRLICSNGLVVPAGETQHWSISHRLSSAVQLMELSEAIASAWSSVKLAQSVLERACNVPVNPVQVIDQLNVFSPSQRVKLKASLSTARAEDDVQTAYGLYNFINEFDRTTARKNSSAYLSRDTEMLNTILTLAQIAA